MEELLADELRSLSLSDVKSIKHRRAGADADLSLEDIYRVCLWSRVANRVLYPLDAFKIADEKSYYEALKKIQWDEHVDVGGTVAVDFFCQSSCITHSQYGAQLTKDSVVDWFRDKTGQRPSVDRNQPDIRINVYLFKNRARISLDMAGSSLHRRNYRRAGVEAPLKENLAACILLKSGWPTLIKRGAPLLDPMCGSGTFLIEAAMMAADTAPGLQRDYFGFLSWKHHDEALWLSVTEEAQQRKEQGLESMPEIAGFDNDERAVNAAEQNIAAAGFDGLVKVGQADFFSASDSFANGPGLVVVNPPYGERLEDESTIGVFYSKLGRALRQKTPNWELALFTGNPSLFHRTGLSRQVVLECRNGDLDCKLFRSKLPPRSQGDGVNSGVDKPDTEENNATDNVWSKAAANKEDNKKEAVKGLDQFRGRLKKNIRSLAGWLKSAGVSNYRIYDADLPDFAFALDVYRSDEQVLVSLQEYRAPSHIDPVLAQQRIDAALPVVCELLVCLPDNLAVKRRERQRGESQYQRVEKTNRYHQVVEGDCRMLVNLHDYLDTGLFLDHRKVRLWIATAAADKQLLNLYCYTASASVHAALGGAAGSVSVDLSPKYIEWAQKNFALNEIDPAKHQLIKADCTEWVRAQRSQPERYDLIFLDPPTFSNSTAMQTDWDVQKNHESMIDDCMAILSESGTLIFSNNYRRFRLAEKLREKYQVEDRTKWSIQRDFARNPKVHQCWFIRPSA